MKRMLLPREDTVSAVKKWLVDGSVKNIQVEADWINIRTTVGIANELLSTEFAWYTSEDFGKRLRTLEYSVPDDVADHINTVQPTIRFGQGVPEHATHQTMEDSEIMGLSAAADNATDCVSTSATFLSQANLVRINILPRSVYRTCTRSTTKPMLRVVVR